MNREPEVELAPRRWLRRLASLPLIFLGIEFLDELAFGALGAALPEIRRELHFSYAEAGLLLAVPGVVSTLIEPGLLVLGDTRLRRGLVIVGGAGIALALAMIAGATGFPALLAAMILAYPASGMFVTLSQATLMDLHPGRSTAMMARWTAAGSAGVVLGPFLLAGAFGLQLGWRPVIGSMAMCALALALALAAARFPRRPPAEESGHLRALIRSIRECIGRPGLIRWIVLLQVSDLMLDVFLMFVPLYLADVVGLGMREVAWVLGALGVGGWLSNLALIPLLERVPSRRLIRATAAIVAVLLPALLLVPSTAAKLGLLLLISLATVGWYPGLMGEAFAAAPQASATVTALVSLAGILGSAAIGLLGALAESAGLPSAMGMLWISPLALLLFVPRRGSVE